jgi:hypothetical protein|tara:strand:- start:1052 stop:1240 length:189 start_codon:yes stop_codon:yes gene_type:complete
MQLLLFLIQGVGALFIVASIFQVALEIRRFRNLLEKQFMLEPYKTDSGKIEFRKTRDKFEDV